ncbi:MAG: DUF3298 domain-containing protein [Bacteroidota bacterium]|nr:DUF3298 domain-containing protein [Bacteroidota bacterium]
MKKILCLMAFAMPLITVSQELPEDVFYKHMEGNIDKTLYLSMNLIKTGDSLFGNYYHWYIEHEGAGKPEYSGPQIPLTGKMISPTEFVLHEFGEKNSYFEGLFVNGSRMEGIWKNKQTGKELPFEIYEKYPRGSMAFSAHNKIAEEELVIEDLSPKARLDLLLLSPVDFPVSAVSDSVKKIIYVFFIDDYRLRENAGQVLEKTVADFFRRYRESNEELHQMGHAFNWEKITSTDILYNEDYVLSLGLVNYAFTGGAHGLQVRKYFVFDLTSGQKLSLNDVFTSGYEKDLDSLLNRKLRIKYDIPDETSLAASGFFMDTIPVSNNFYLNKSGVNFHYNSYEIAPYSWGHVELLIPYRELVGMLKEDGVVKRIR